jgi:type III pantothenate kinase
VNLIIDQGNTSVKIALFDGGEILKIATFENSLSEEIKNYILGLEFSNAIYSSVSKRDDEIITLLSGRASTVVTLNYQTPLPIEVEYATPLTEQTGSVAAIVSTHSSRERPSASIVEMIFEVSVERILALTPLPKPSESTTTVELSSGSTISIWSPQSCSP